jgi:hypothetical protein
MHVLFQGVGKEPSRGTFRHIIPQDNSTDRGYATRVNPVFDDEANSESSDVNATRELRRVLDLSTPPQSKPNLFVLMNRRPVAKKNPDPG